MNKFLPLITLLTIIFSSCTETDPKSSFAFEKHEQGVELLENGEAVYFYQKEPKSLTGEFVCNNYLHPLYSLNGDTLTEEFPEDHPHHRGVFWAWHQLYIDGQSVGDGWIMENIKQEVADLRTEISDSAALLKLNILWSSALFGDKPFVTENTTIAVHPVENDVRKIDFTIALKALVPGVEIGGSDDVKGYGGFCARIKLPDDLAFTSEKGAVTPQTEQIIAGPWMDFSSSFRQAEEISGLTILCHPRTPNYPAPWILRAESSMQNIVFPGRDRVALSLKEPVVLFYRLIVHNGGAGSVDISKLQSEYEKSAVVK